MTRKQRRGMMILAAVGALAMASILVLFALRDTIVFFYAPSDVAEKQIARGQRFRLGGLVAAGSVERGGGQDVQFAVTDTQRSVVVSFRGILPDLFREGQGIVAEGKLDPGGSFRP